MVSQAQLRGVDLFSAAVAAAVVGIRVWSVSADCVFCVCSAGEFKIPGEAATTEHAIEATADWKKYTFWGIGAVGAMGVLQFFIHMSHGHHEDLTLYPFRRIRNKPFPWGDGQHSLFGCSIDDAE